MEVRHTSCQIKSPCFSLSFCKKEKNTVLNPLISARSQISAAPLGIHIEINASPLISAAPLFDNFVGLALKRLRKTIFDMSHFKMKCLNLNIDNKDMDQGFKNGPSKICGNAISLQIL